MDSQTLDYMQNNGSVSRNLDRSFATGCSDFINTLHQGKRKIQQSTCNPFSRKETDSFQSNHSSTLQPTEDDKENGISQLDFGDGSFENEQWINVKVVLEKKEGLGFCIKGSKPVFISSVKPNGQAKKKGLLVNDVLFSINGQNVFQHSSKKVANILRNCASTITLEVKRPLRLVEGCSFSTSPKAVLNTNKVSSKQSHTPQPNQRASLYLDFNSDSTKEDSSTGKKPKMSKYAAQREKYMRETYGQMTRKSDNFGLATKCKSSFPEDDPDTQCSNKHDGVYSMLDTFLKDSVMQMKQTVGSICLSPHNYTSNTISQSKRQSIFEQKMNVFDDTEFVNVGKSSTPIYNVDYLKVSENSPSGFYLSSPELARKRSISGNAAIRNGFGIDMMPNVRSKSNGCFDRSTPSEDTSLMLDIETEQSEHLELSCMPNALLESPSIIFNDFLHSKISLVSTKNSGTQENTQDIAKHVAGILACLEAYVSFMFQCVHSFSRPLRFMNILSPKQYELIFQNLEKLTYVASSILTEMLNCDKTEIDAVKLVDSVNAQLPDLNAYFEHYVNGLPDAFQLLRELNTSETWTSFLQHQTHEISMSLSDCITLESFLWMPLCHVTELYSSFRALKEQLVSQIGERHKNVVELCTMLESMVERIQDTDYEAICSV